MTYEDFSWDWPQCVSCKVPTKPAELCSDCQRCEECSGVEAYHTNIMCSGCCVGASSFAQELIDDEGPQ